MKMVPHVAGLMLKKQNPSWITLECHLCCCLLPVIFMLFLASEMTAESSSAPVLRSFSQCYRDGCGDVAHGASLAGGVRDESSLHPSGPGTACMCVPQATLQVITSLTAAASFVVPARNANSWQPKQHLQQVCGSVVLVQHGSSLDKGIWRF